MKSSLFVLCALIAGWIAFKDAVNRIPPTSAPLPLPEKMLNHDEEKLIGEMERGHTVHIDLSRATAVVPSAGTWYGISYKKRKTIADLCARYWYDEVGRRAQVGSGTNVQITPRITIEEAGSGRFIAGYNTRDGFYSDPR